MLAKNSLMAFAGAPSSGRSDNLRKAMAVQIIEENPLDAEQIQMFEMFEREKWPHEDRRAYLTDRTRRS